MYLIKWRSSSCVFKAHNHDTNETVALKRIYFLEKNEGVPSSAIREVSFLKEMDHSNVIRNLLIDCKSILKRADFGSAREIGVPLQRYTEGEMVASLWYTAPELLLSSRKYSTPVDIWSVDCVFAEMVIQQPLFTGYTELTQVIKIFSIMGKPNEETWPGNLAELVLGLEPAAVDLLSKMLCMNPEGRITASEALEHPYFDDILESP
ncbi:unnamed protein product [Camellia sinensis]